MAWVRGGDTSATYPPVMQVVGLADADERSVNEVMGFVMRLAFLSAAHTTDYVVDLGTVHLVGGARTEVLLRQCKRLKLLTEVRVDKMRAYKIVEDPDFLHLRLKAELEWEQQQRADTKNEALTVPVRLRDGDQCRYCGVVVMWLGRRSNRTGTFDHVNPGEAATVTTLVVACLACNSGLRDVHGREHEQLRPPPTNPIYTEFTADWLTSRGEPVTATPRPDRQPDTAPRTTRTKRTTGQRPGSQPDHASTGQRPDHVSDTASTRGQRPGSQPDHATLSDPTDQAGHRAQPAPPRAEKSTSKSNSGDFARCSEGGLSGSGRDGTGDVPLLGTGPTTKRTPARSKRSPRGRHRNASGDPA